MVESRWLRWIGPGIVAIGALGLVASTTLGAGVQRWLPRACGGPSSDRITAARVANAAGPVGLRSAPWYRLDPVLDSDGALRGQHLTFGLGSQQTARSLDFGAEAFAAGPFGGVILAGSDDGAISRLLAIDVAKGCAWAVGQERAVIRRATLDPAGTFIYESRVDRADRADLGIWRRRMEGGAAAVRVLAPPAPDGRFGRTFATEFTWDLAGDRLAVQSCGEVACRTRVIAPRGGAPMTLEAPDLGLLVGLDGNLVVTYQACRGLPCPIVATDLRTGLRRVLAVAAGLATVVPTADGSRLIDEVRTASGRGLRSVGLDGETTADLGPLPDGLRLQPSPGGAGPTTRLQPGWVLLAPDGHMPPNGTAEHPQLRHVPDGSTAQLDEVQR
jgi:hypothetical protein